MFVLQFTFACIQPAGSRSRGFAGTMSCRRLALSDGPRHHMGASDGRQQRMKTTLDISILAISIATMVAVGAGLEIHHSTELARRKRLVPASWQSIAGGEYGANRYLVRR